jgi:hypothetical protein
MTNISQIELLNQKLQQSIQDIKIESFIFNGEITEVYSVYLKFDIWISLFFDDGILFIKEGLSGKQQKIQAGSNVIEYKYLEPFMHLIDVEHIRNKRFLNLVKENNTLRLMFDNGVELVIGQEVLAGGEFVRTIIEIKE